MQVAILGPLEVRDDRGRPLEIAGARLRTLLVRLALEPGRSIATSALVDAVWGERPPAEAANALQTLVSRLRRSLASPGVVVQSASGYRLGVQPDDVDVHRFEQRAAAGSAALRNADAARAIDELDEALALWRGPALADALNGTLHTAAARLDDLRVAALADRAEAGMAAGESVDAAALLALDALAAEHPLDERLTDLLMRALGTSGRQADALQAYERLRRRLAEELGVDPAPELQQTHLTILRGELAPPAQPRRRRTNLKTQLTTFVGRDDEVARIAELLERQRLVTLVGPGGAGKTRLACEAAARMIEPASDGVWLAELAPVTSGDDVPQAVLGSVGLREIHLMDRGTTISARDAIGRLLDGLAERRTVLVLDNCEHVLDASAALAEQLLSACPGLRVLATSREPLGITGETLLAVPPLGRPAPDTSAGEAIAYPAVRLFADRAAAVAPDFVADDDTVADVIEIVRRLDGLPLAIELAAARLRSMPLDDIAARLSDRFRLLTGGSRTALPRHRTLRAVVQWSWDLLGPAERAFAEQLAVFPAGITLDSATAVRPDEVDASDAADLLASLVEKSLLQPTGDRRRMRMLETIREYGIERLAERDALAAARLRHADHFAAMAAEATPHLTTSGQLPWFVLLEAERDNIVAALRFRCDIGDADGALHIAVSLSWYSMLLGDHAEISSWTQQALAVPGGTDPTLTLVARSLHALGSAAGGSGASEVDGGLAMLRQVVAELAGVDASAHPSLALIRPAAAFFTGQLDLLRRFADEAIAGDDAWARAAVRALMAGLAENEGDVEAMRRETSLALAEFRALGERWGLASTLRTAAIAQTLDGDLDAAVGSYEEALALTAELHSDDDHIMIYGRLVDLAMRQGDLEHAREYAQRARECASESGDGIEAVMTLAMLGDVERRLGNQDVAVAAIGSAIERLKALPREHMMQGHIRSMILGVWARLALQEGAAATARERADDALRAALGTRDRPIIAGVIVLRAELDDADGNAVQAAELLGVSATVRGAADPTDVEIAALTDRLITALGMEEFADAYERGRAIAYEEAIARLAQPTRREASQARLR